MQNYYPEGLLIDTQENKSAMKSVSALQDAIASHRILEARAVVCDSGHNLIVELPCPGVRGIIPRAECAVGIEDGSTRDIAIISRVNKPVCFHVVAMEKDASGHPVAILSRRKVQEEAMERYVSQLSCGDVIDARVTHLEPFGCFVDIACGIPSLIPIDAISISRISHPSDRFHNGQCIKAVVKSVDDNGRICLSHKELLGTWDENAALFQSGETVAGIVRSVEDYGVFIELTPNLAGLAEPKEGVQVGQHASVYIKSLIPEKMKVKLIIVDSFDAEYPANEIDYYIDSGHIDSWQYSPACADKVIRTDFF